MVTTAKINLNTQTCAPLPERRKGLHRPAALDYLRRRIENVPPQRALRQMRCCDYLVHCKPSDAEEDKKIEHHGSFRLGPVMMGSTASETIGAILAATRC
jgi:hypothetical protein